MYIKHRNATAGPSHGRSQRAEIGENWPYRFRVMRADRQTDRRTDVYTYRNKKIGINCGSVRCFCLFSLRTAIDKTLLVRVTLFPTAERH